MTKTKISVVIPTHKGFSHVCLAIESLKNQTIKPTEIIIVDNNSEENIAIKVAKKYKNIKTIRLNRNSGVTGGRNAGIMTASNCDYLLIFDHDMWADKNMIKELLKTSKNHKASIVTPKILYKSDKSIIWAAGTGMNLNTGQVLFRGGKDEGQYDRDEEVQVSPAVMLVEKQVIEKLGGFDDRYFATYEDTDFCFRAKQKGLKTFYSSKALAYHDIPIDKAGEAERLLSRGYWVARNRILFMNDFAVNKTLFFWFIPIYAAYYFLIAVRESKLSLYMGYFKGLVAGLINVASSYLKYINYSYAWILRQALGNPTTILDVGCGDGSLMRDIKNDLEQIVGVDIHAESVLQAKASNQYVNVYKANAASLPKKVTSTKYDVVFSSQVVEHLGKKEATKAIKSWDKLAADRIVITTTNGYIDFDPIEDKVDNNPYQKHNSGWGVEEFEKMRFEVHGQGLKVIYGEYGLARRSPKWALPLWGILSILLSWVPYNHPQHSMYLVAVKKH